MIRTAPLSTLYLVCATVLLSACQPADQRPGQWLSGESRPYPDDWSFAHAHREIALEVNTPYFIPHSVTVWCSALDGDLYIGASRPESKNWPGWVDEDDAVRIRVDDDVYEARMEPIQDEALIRKVVVLQAEKYGFEIPSGPTGTRYWVVKPRGEPGGSNRT